jgi:hypothetical protein
MNIRIAIAESIEDISKIPSLRKNFIKEETCHVLIQMGINYTTNPETRSGRRKLGSITT